MRDWDENQIFPVHVFKKLGELGLMGVLVPVEYGGSGFTYTEYVTAIQELSILDPSIETSMKLIIIHCVLVIFYSLEIRIKKISG